MNKTPKLEVEFLPLAEFLTMLEEQIQQSSDREETEMLKNTLEQYMRLYYRYE